MSEVYIPSSAMAIVAHPDDIEFTCAGTLALWVRRGARVSYVICTSGEAGFDQPGMDLKEAASIRQAEQRKAADLAGAEEVIFLDLPDGLLAPTLDLRRTLVREIRRFRPEVVITGDPTVVYSSDTRLNHPDHRAASTAALDAVFPAAGQPNLFPEFEQEGFFAHKPRKVYVYSMQPGDVRVNIDETIDIKLEALRAHVSQMKGWDPEERIRARAAEHANGREMTYAEAFRVITLVSDEDWEKTQGRVVPSESHN